MSEYGKAPEVIASIELDWTEYMHYLYLPIKLPWREADDGRMLIPRRLEFAREVIDRAWDSEGERRDWNYVYVSARRGFATPGNPLNREGWHADGFGGEDVNYTWADRYPTQFAVQQFSDISPGHADSMRGFEDQLDPSKVITYPDSTLLRMDPYVVHSVPEIPPPGGTRGFLKVSFSNQRYNLEGNSHNYLFDYRWDMHKREVVRNDPVFAGRDSGAQ